MANSKAYQPITEGEWKLEGFTDDNMLGVSLSVEIPANQYNLKQRIIVSHVVDLVQAKLRERGAPELSGKPGSYSFLFGKEMVSTIEAALNKQYRVRLSKMAETDKDIHYILNDDKFGYNRANKVVEAIANIVVENSIVTTKPSTPIWLALTCGLIGSSKPTVTATSNDFEKLATALTTKLAQNLDYSRESSLEEEANKGNTSSGRESPNKRTQKRPSIAEVYIEDVDTSPTIPSRKHHSKNDLKRSPNLETINGDKRLVGLAVSSSLTI